MSVGSAAATLDLGGCSPAILGRLGWVEGENLTIDRRFADGDERAAAELGALHPDALIAVSGPDAEALLLVTSRSVTD